MFVGSVLNLYSFLRLLFPMLLLTVICGVIPVVFMFKPSATPEFVYAMCVSSMYMSSVFMRDIGMIVNFDVFV